MLYVQRNIEARPYNYYCSGKAISVTNSECVSVALGVQHAMLMHHIMLSSVACSALQHFSTFTHWRHDSRKKHSWAYNMFWFSLQILSETFLILRRMERYMIRYACRSLLFLSDFNETCIFWTDFRKILNHQILWKSLQWSQVDPCGQMWRPRLR